MTHRSLDRASLLRGYRLAVLSLSHFTVDCYSTFLGAILVVVLAPRLSFSPDAAARLLALHVVVLSLGQPLFGYLSDRVGGRWLVILAPLVGGLSAGRFLAAPSLAWLVALIVVQAAAVAAFHPEGVALATSIDPRRAATSTAVFMAAGPVGQTLAPLLITWAAVQVRVPAWIPAWGVAVSLLLFVTLPPGALRRPRLSRRGGLREALRAGHVRPLALLVALSAMRYLVSVGLSFAVPVLLLERLTAGEAIARTGWWLSLLLGGGALGGILGSALVGRRSRRRVMAAAFLAAALLVAALPHLHGVTAVVALFAAGLALGWPAPLLVVMGQRAMPRAAAMASALMLGVSWALGGPAAPVVFQWVRGLTSTGWAITALGSVGAVAACTALCLPPEIES